MVGGGIGSYVGVMRCRAISLDTTAVLIAVCFSLTYEKPAHWARRCG